MGLSPDSNVQVVQWEHFTITASDGELRHCDARFLDTESALPVIIFVHGFKGFKDWGSNPYICESLARRGYFVISFNFSHNGVEENSTEFTRLDKFAENTFTREVRELDEVIEGVAAGKIPHAERLQRSSTGILGHSRGGGIAILATAANAHIKALAVWAAVAGFERYTERQKAQWRTDGFLESKNMRTGQLMRLNVSLLDDLEQNASALDVENAAATLNRPLLIVHGEQDLSVRIEDGENLYSASDKGLTRFERIPRTNHTFGAVHPFQGTTPELETALTLTSDFFKQALSNT